jgi:hypothetical protein
MMYTGASMMLMGAVKPTTEGRMKFLPVLALVCVMAPAVVVVAMLSG